MNLLDKLTHRPRVMLAIGWELLTSCVLLLLAGCGGPVITETDGPVTHRVAFHGEHIGHEAESIDCLTKMLDVRLLNLTKALNDSPADTLAQLQAENAALKAKLAALDPVRVDGDCRSEPPVKLMPAFGRVRSIETIGQKVVIGVECDGAVRGIELANYRCPAEQAELVTRTIRDWTAGVEVTLFYRADNSRFTGELNLGRDTRVTGGTSLVRSLVDRGYGGLSP